MKQNTHHGKISTARIDHEKIALQRHPAPMSDNLFVLVGKSLGTRLCDILCFEKEGRHLINRKITAAHLIDEYLGLKKKLGRRPTCIEFSRHHHSITTLRAVFGDPGWANLLNAAGEHPRLDKVSAREHLIEDYRELKRALGRTPTCLEYARKHHSITSLRSAFGGPGWTNLQLAAGEDPKRTVHFTRDMLIQAYHTLKENLGRQPRVVEYHKACCGQSVINRLFGKAGWRRLVEAAGDKPLVEYNLPAGHLINDFLDLQARLGRRPKVAEYRRQCHSPKALERAFGKPGWRKLIAAVGGKALPKNILSAEHLIQDYLDTCKGLGYRPSYEEFKERHRHSMKVLARVFGKPGWSNLQKAVRSVRHGPGKALASRLKATLRCNGQDSMNPSTVLR